MLSLKECTRQLIRSITLILFLAVMLCGQGFANASNHPGQSQTLLPDGRWLILGGEGEHASTALIEDRRSTPVVIEILNRRLHQPRSYHTATVLADGQVFIFGGTDTSGQTLTAPELFDPITKTFQPLDVFDLAPRAHHTATLLTNGLLLLAGGKASDHDVLQTAQLWNWQSGQVEPITPFLNTARFNHNASLLPESPVLISGGQDAYGETVLLFELYNPATQNFETSEASVLHDNVALPQVVDSIPYDQAVDVPLDVVIAVRFSQSVDIAALNHDNVTLMGPLGEVSANVVGAEEGKLLFVTPDIELFPGTHYTLFLSDIDYPDGKTLAFTSLSFSTEARAALPNNGNRPLAITLDQTHFQDGSSRGQTVDQRGQDPDSSQHAADPALWVPGESHRRGVWKINARKSLYQALPTLEAAPGITALSGQVLRIDGTPVSNATLSIEGKTAKTNEHGQFIIEGLDTGVFTLSVDARSAETSQAQFGVYDMRVDVPLAKTTNVLPFIIWMPKLHDFASVSIPSPTTEEVVVTSPHIPGLELRIPEGMVIRDRDGQVVNEVSITPIPIDRSPFPLPTSDVPVYFTIQPGGATLHSTSASGIRGARLIYPNYTDSPPGTVKAFWTYDPREKGWYRYGLGRVSEDGKQVIPDDGVMIYEFTGAMVSDPNNEPDEKPEEKEDRCEGGDPVDCSSGVFIHSRVDLAISDTIPLVLRRTYQSGDIDPRAFGIGMNHDYNMFLVGDIWPYTYTRLVQGDGSTIQFDRTSPGTGFSGAVYEHQGASVKYKGAVIRFKDQMGLWELTLRDGTRMYFPDSEGFTNYARAAVIEIIDRHGNSVHFDRDWVTGRLKQVTSPNGKFIKFNYDSGGRILEAIDNIGRTVSYLYDAGGRLISVTNPLGGVESYAYNSANRMVSVTLPSGETMVTNTYNGAYVVKQVLADGAETTFSYHTSPPVTYLTDSLGNVRRMAFNSNRQVTSVTHAFGTPEARTISQTYGSHGLVSSQTDSLGRKTEYNYDAYGNITSVKRLANTPEAVTESYAYDPVYSLLISYTNALGHTTHFDRDAVGNVTAIRGPSGDTLSTFTYNTAGQIITTADALGNTTQFEYESGDLIAVVDPLGHRTTQFSDSVGRLIHIVDALGRVQKADYDALNRLTQSTNALNGTTRFAYDVMGNLTSLTDANTGVTSYSYDARNRLASRTDALGNVESYSYDGENNLLQHTERNGKIRQYSYDALHRLTQATYGAPANGTPDATVTYSYDGASRITQITDTQGDTLTFEYDNLDRLVKETSSQGSIAYTYDAAGQRTSMTVAGQTSVIYSYDSLGRITAITQGLDTVNYTYDAASRLTNISFPNGIGAAYVYDAASRLTDINYSLNTTPIGNLRYTFDAVGKRVRISGSMVRTLLPSPLNHASYNAANQLIAWEANALNYDANGNLTSAATNTYTWDSRNRLIATNAGNSHFKYDTLGRRFEKTVNGTTTGFLHDGDHVVQELNNGSVTANLLVGAGVDAYLQRREGQNTTSFITDALGSTIALADENGALINAYAYEPFGKSQSSGSSTNTFQYTGRENDGNGLYYYRARYYIPGLQRFISEDPIGFAGGINLYGYVSNDPVNFNDPFGHVPAGAWPSNVPHPLDLLKDIFRPNVPNACFADPYHNESEGDHPHESGDNNRQKGDRFNDSDSASDQYEDIQREQNRRRKLGDNVSIDSIEKSRQRDRNRLRPHNIDLDNLDDFD